MSAAATGKGLLVASTLHSMLRLHHPVATSLLADSTLNSQHNASLHCWNALAHHVHTVLGCKPEHKGWLPI